ncbi:unnamed protein product [Allacma fusca]|uniref:Uncharacterized protein n=1 Tax=Allacma fusca TaxID=39272 RepID=A0A8J2J1A9_9HEXA|nr:unnamed protein product [Allacma fusca]
MWTLKMSSDRSGRSIKSARGTFPVKGISEDEISQRSFHKSRSTKKQPPRSVAHHQERNKENIYESDEKLWGNNLHSDSSSEPGSESANPDDTSTTSMYQHMCSKYVHYINPCTFLRQFTNDEGTQELLTDIQRRDFFCFVMLIKCLQLLMIASLITLPSASPSLEGFLRDFHRHYVLIPFGLCSCIVALTRMCPLFRKMNSFYHAVGFFVVTCCYGYILASLSCFYSSHVISKVFWILPASVLFMAIFTVAMNLSVVRRLIYISALSSVLFFATAMALLPIVYEGNPGFEVSVDIWLPAVIAAEILIFLLIFELQSIIIGERGTIHKNDFLYPLVMSMHVVTVEFLFVPIRVCIQHAERLGGYRHLLIRP